MSQPPSPTETSLSAVTPAPALLPAPDSRIRAALEASAPSACLADRVAALPAATVARWLANAVRFVLHKVTARLTASHLCVAAWSVMTRMASPPCCARAQGVAVPDPDGGGVLSHPQPAPGSGNELPWGFARGMPSLDELFAAAAAAPGDFAGTAAGPSRNGDSAEGDGGRGGETEAAATQSLYMRRLQESRAFHCPDATECMAEALGAKDALQGLQVGPRLQLAC